MSPDTQRFSSVTPFFSVSSVGINSSMSPALNCSIAPPTSPCSNGSPSAPCSSPCGSNEFNFPFVNRSCNEPALADRADRAKDLNSEDRAKARTVPSEQREKATTHNEKSSDDCACAKGPTFDDSISCQKPPSGFKGKGSRPSARGVVARAARMVGPSSPRHESLSRSASSSSLGCGGGGEWLRRTSSAMRRLSTVAAGAGRAALGSMVASAEVPSLALSGAASGAAPAFGLASGNGETGFATGYEIKPKNQMQKNKNKNFRRSRSVDALRAAFQKEADDRVAEDLSVRRGVGGRGRTPIRVASAFVRPSPSTVDLSPPPQHPPPPPPPSSKRLCAPKVFVAAAEPFESPAARRPQLLVAPTRRRSREEETAERITEGGSEEVQETAMVDEGLEEETKIEKPELVLNIMLGGAVAVDDSGNRRSLRRTKSFGGSWGNGGGGGGVGVVAGSVGAVARLRTKGSTDSLYPKEEIRTKDRIAAGTDWHGASQSRSGTATLSSRSRSGAFAAPTVAGTRVRDASPKKERMKSAAPIKASQIHGGKARRRAREKKEEPVLGSYRPEPTTPTTMTTTSIGLKSKTRSKMKKNGEVETLVSIMREQEEEATRRTLSEYPPPRQKNVEVLRHLSSRMKQMAEEKEEVEEEEEERTRRERGIYEREGEWAEEEGREKGVALEGDENIDAITTTTTTSPQRRVRSATESRKEAETPAPFADRRAHSAKTRADGKAASPASSSGADSKAGSSAPRSGVDSKVAPSASRTRAESARIKASARQLKNGSLFTPMRVDPEEYYSARLQDREKKPHVPRASDCVRKMEALRRAASSQDLIDDDDDADVIRMSTRRRTPMWSNSRRVFECEEIHDRLKEKGVSVSRETLQRALLPPPFASGEFRLPRDYSSGLLSCPSTWFRH